MTAISRCRRWLGSHEIGSQCCWVCWLRWRFLGRCFRDGAHGATRLCHVWCFCCWLCFLVVLSLPIWPVVLLPLSPSVAFSTRGRIFHGGASLTFLSDDSGVLGWLGGLTAIGSDVTLPCFNLSIDTCPYLAVCFVVGSAPPSCHQLFRYKK